MFLVLFRCCISFNLPGKKSYKILAYVDDRATRTPGSITGLFGNYVWGWYFWRDAYKYVMSPFALFLCGTGLACDLAYPIVLWRVKERERMLSDGRNIGKNTNGAGMERKVK
jgi:hypothetical protein